MTDILDVAVGESWVDIYDVAGITAGNPLEIMVKGLYGVYLMESATEPASATLGKPLTNTSGNYAVATVLAGSSKVWVRCDSAKSPFITGTTVAVQERV